MFVNLVGFSSAAEFFAGKRWLRTSTLHFVTRSVVGHWAGPTLMREEIAKKAPARLLEK
jgi:hypothetical protein